MRYLLLAATTAVLLIPAGAAAAQPSGGPAPPVVEVVTTVLPALPAASGAIPFPSGCRNVDVYAQQTSFLFHTRIYRLHQLKHWCWRAGVIYDERHAWSFEGSATACLNTVYPANGWFFTWWYGKSASGHYSEERAHVTNCIFHFGDWKEFYPDVKIWSYADGGYNVATSN